MARKGLVLLLLLLSALAAGGAGSAAAAPAPVGSPGPPRWNLTITPEPTVFAPGAKGEIYLVTATNVGGVAAAPVVDPETGEETPIRIAVRLPAGLEFESGALESLNLSGGSSVSSPCKVKKGLVNCTAGVPVEPGQQLFAFLDVEVTAAAGAEVTGSAEVSGGGAPSVAVEAATPVNLESAPPGLAAGSFFQTVSTSQAGAHPNAGAGFSVTTRRRTESNGSEIYEPSGSVRTVQIETPAGLIGSARATPKCESAQFTSGTCPADSKVGVESAIINITGGGRKVGLKPIFSGTTPLYNLTPSDGTPAEFGFTVLTVSVVVKAELRSDGDYGLNFEVGPISQAGSVFSSATTFFGTPAALNRAGSAPTPLVYSPTSCEGPQQTKLTLGFYQTPALTTALSAPLEWSGCDLVPFMPTFAATPTTATSDSPTGLDVDVHLPQDPNGEGLATTDLRDATVTLPQGVAINPSAASGLLVCTPAQFGLTSAVGAIPVRTTADPAACPEAAKIGTVEIDTPLLEDPIPGAIYAAQQRENPFGGLLAIYLAAYDPQRGVVIKLAGKVAADPGTGQLTATFQQNPQVPFEDIKLDFFGGPRAALRTPLTCGTGQTTARLTPWSGGAAVERSAAFAVDSNAAGACAGSEGDLPNAPAFEAGTVDPSAGTYSPFLLKFSRAGGTQLPGSLTAKLPAGLLAKLAGVAYCPDATLGSISDAEGSGAAEAAAPSCPSDSQIGTVSVAAGAGSSPFRLESGKAYLAGPYKGAPLSLAVVAPAVAGPFDLGSVVVRTALQVDSTTTQVTAFSDGLPTILHGIPLDLREVRVDLDRHEFTVNPTDCEPSAVAGTITSTTGAAAAVETKFRAADCEKLAFAPELSLQVRGKTGRGAKPSLHAVLTRRDGEANIARARVNLPRSEFLEQGDIKTVCTRAQFAAGGGHGAGCPSGSVYGHARAYSPLLRQPLEGPVYLRSSSNKLPDLVAALNGQIDVELAGRIDSGPNKGIRNTFEAVPDAPVSRFVLDLFGGKRGLLVNSENLCAKDAQTHAIVRLTGQNGKVADSRPSVASSCHKRKRK